jgi:hypothetical protein
VVISRLRRILLALPVVLLFGASLSASSAHAASSTLAANLTPVGTTGLLAPSKALLTNYCNASSYENLPNRVVTSFTLSNLSYGVSGSVRLYAKVSPNNSNIYCDYLDPTFFYSQASGQPVLQFTCWLQQWEGLNTISQTYFQNINSQPGVSNPTICGYDDWAHVSYQGDVGCNGGFTFSAQWHDFYNGNEVNNGGSGKWCQSHSAQCSNAQSTQLTSITGTPTDDPTITVDIDLYGWMGGQNVNIYCDKLDPYTVIHQSYLGLPQTISCHIVHIDTNTGNVSDLGGYAQITSSPGQTPQGGSSPVNICGYGDWASILVSDISCPGFWDAMNETDHLNVLNEATWWDYSPEWCYGYSYD